MFTMESLSRCLREGVVRIKANLADIAYWNAKFDRFARYYGRLTGRALRSTPLCSSYSRGWSPVRCSVSAIPGSW